MDWKEISLKAATLKSQRDSARRLARQMKAERDSESRWAKEYLESAQAWREQFLGEQERRAFIGRKKSKLESENARLKEENERQHNALLVAADEIQKANGEIDLLAGMCKESERDNADLNDERTRLKAERDGYEEGIYFWQNWCVKLQNERDELERENETYNLLNDYMDEAGIVSNHPHAESDMIIALIKYTKAIDVELDKEQADNARLKKLLEDRWLTSFAEGSHLRETMDQLEADNVRLRELIRQVEWCENCHHCPYCKVQYYDPHKESDCPAFGEDGAVISP